MKKAKSNSYAGAIAKNPQSRDRAHRVHRKHKKGIALAPGAFKWT